MTERIVIVVAGIVFASLMALRNELPTAALRAATAALAAVVGGLALSHIVKSRADRKRRDD